MQEWHLKVFIGSRLHCGQLTMFTTLTIDFGKNGSALMLDGLRLSHYPGSIRSLFSRRENGHCFLHSSHCRLDSWKPLRAKMGPWACCVDTYRATTIRMHVGWAARFRNANALQFHMTHPNFACLLQMVHIFLRRATSLPCLVSKLKGVLMGLFRWLVLKIVSPKPYSSL